MTKRKKTGLEKDKTEAKEYTLGVIHGCNQSFILDSYSLKWWSLNFGSRDQFHERQLFHGLEAGMVQVVMWAMVQAGAGDPCFKGSTDSDTWSDREEWKWNTSGSLQRPRKVSGLFLYVPRSNYLSFVSQNKFPRRRTWNRDSFACDFLRESSPVESVRDKGKQREKSGIGLGPVEWGQGSVWSQGGSGLGISHRAALTRSKRHAYVSS